MDTHPLKSPSGSATATEPDLGNRNSNRIDLNKAGNISHPENRKHIESFLIDFDLINLDGGFVGDEIHATFTLFFLELQRDATNGTLLDPLHEMGGKAGDLVAETLGRDDSHFFDDLLVGVEIKRHARVVPLDHMARGFLYRLGADSAHGSERRRGSGWLGVLQT